MDLLDTLDFPDVQGIPNLPDLLRLLEFPNVQDTPNLLDLLDPFELPQILEPSGYQVLSRLSKSPGTSRPTRTF